jgi:hypothetical protein
VPCAFRFAIAIAMLAGLARGAAAQEQEQPYKSADPGYPYSVYREVAEDVLSLKLVPDDSRTFSCEHNYYGANPCLSSISPWRNFADRFQLERNRISAQIFQAYIRRDYRMGDRLYAEMKGYELPPYGGYEGPGLEVLAFDLAPDTNQEQGCENNPFADDPCTQSAAAWRAFSKKHGLPQNRQGGAIFQAYVNGDFVRGDRLYSALTDRRTQYEVVHSGIGNEVMALNMGVSTSERDACDIDPFGFNPCNGAIRVLRNFAKKYGLEANQAAGKLMQAYANGDLRRGDRLFASAKGVSVETLLDKYLGPDRPKERELPRLIIDIRAELPNQDLRPRRIPPTAG